MDEFIRRANIEHYRQLLEQTTDEAERALILKLLADEEAKTPSSPVSRTG
jgi:hypothetical protein